MILEHALIPIKSGQSKEFEAAFVEARKFIEAAEGFQKLEMRACIERVDNYLLLVWWTSVEAHMSTAVPRANHPAASRPRASTGTTLLVALLSTSNPVNNPKSATTW